jgi:hypothetical protein
MVTEDGECTIAPMCPDYITKMNIGGSCCKMSRLGNTPQNKGGGNGTRAFCTTGPEGQPCGATYRADGWFGCICDYGDENNDKCTLECDEAYGCPFPDDGIAPAVDEMHDPLAQHLLHPNFVQLAPGNSLGASALLFVVIGLMSS